MIVIEKLAKKYADKAILKDISLTINKGEIYGVVGISGAGKSTLLRCLNGLEDYEGGSIKINNLEVKNLTEKEQQAFRKKIGMVFQDFTLLSRKNVFDNIALPMKCWGYSKKKKLNLKSLNYYY
ncbi:ATP-binding cassette domain-containing protein [Enterococcus rivorum]|uniref:ATP-binding cassette domain-containing protein n=1 Tax=Enterococcus rivorum TaxID=762845 RepID=UPI003625B2DD